MSKRTRRDQRERAKRAEKRGSQGPRAPEAAEKILALSAVPRQENSADIHARVLARAREVDSSIHRARVRFCKTLTDGEFVHGETSAALADLWGLSTATVQRDMSIARAEVEEAASGVDHAIWWHGMYELLEQSRGDAALVSEAVDNMRDGSGRLVVNEMGLKMISDALGRSRDSVLKVQDQLGKALGLSSSGTSIEVKVAIGGQRVPSSQAAELASKAYAFFEVELERKMLARCPNEPTLAAEVVGWFLEYVGAAGDVVEVPALPAGRQ